MDSQWMGTVKDNTDTARIYDMAHSQLPAGYIVVLIIVIFEGL